MSFFLKKFITAFLMPVPIGLFLLFLALYFLFVNSYKKAKIFLLLGLCWFLLLSFQPVSNALLKPLERSFPSLLETPNVEYILVLGSGHKSDDEQTITSQVKSVAINRLVEGIRHYKNLQNAKLIVSGYGSSDKNSHALMQERLAISLGVKKEDIIRLDSPKDTKEEAIETQKIVGDKKLILVTSASHMLRASKLFKKQGLDVIESPTNHLSYSDDSFTSYISGNNIKKCEYAVHEYMGLVYSYLRNEI